LIFQSLNCFLYRKIENDREVKNRNSVNFKERGREKSEKNTEMGRGWRYMGKRMRVLGSPLLSMIFK
jgi:hypothetical protein